MAFGAVALLLMALRPGISILKSDRDIIIACAATLGVLLGFVLVFYAPGKISN